MMETLINDLLDLSKMEINEFKLDQSYFNLEHAVNEALQMMRFQANKLDIKLKAEIDYKDNLELVSEMYGDRRRYMQILLNFLSNSMKFTNKKGTVTVKIMVLSHQEIKNENENCLIYMNL